MPDFRRLFHRARHRQRPLTRRAVIFRAAGLAAHLIAGWGGWQGGQAKPGHPPPPSVPASVGAVATPAPPAVATVGLQRSAPVKISIQSINVSASVDQIGLASDGTLEEQ